MTAATRGQALHKPEPMHYGTCPRCHKVKICVLLTPTPDGSVLATRCYFLRRHKCGSRILPVLGSLKQLRNLPDLTLTEAKR